MFYVSVVVNVVSKAITSLRPRCKKPVYTVSLAAQRSVLGSTAGYELVQKCCCCHLFCSLLLRSLRASLPFGLFALNYLVHLCFLNIHSGSMTPSMCIFAVVIVVVCCLSWNRRNIVCWLLTILLLVFGIRRFPKNFYVYLFCFCNA